MFLRTALQARARIGAGPLLPGRLICVLSPLSCWLAAFASRGKLYHRASSMGASRCPRNFRLADPVTCPSPCTSQNWVYTAPQPSPGGTVTVTATATVTLPDSQLISASNSAVISLGTSPIITFPTPVQSINGILGASFTLNYQTSQPINNPSVQWKFTGAVSLINCTLNTTLSCQLNTSVTSLKVIQITACVDTFGAKTVFCSSTPATIEIVPPCKVSLIKNSQPRMFTETAGDVNVGYRRQGYYVGY